MKKLLAIGNSKKIFQTNIELHLNISIVKTSSKQEIFMRIEVNTPDPISALEGINTIFPPQVKYLHCPILLQKSQATSKNYLVAVSDKKLQWSGCEGFPWRAVAASYYFQPK